MSSGALSICKTQSHFSISLDQCFTHPGVDFITGEDAKSNPETRKIASVDHLMSGMNLLHFDSFLDLNPATKQNILRLEICFQIEHPSNPRSQVKSAVSQSSGQPCEKVNSPLVQ